MTDTVAAGGTATISRGAVQTLLDILAAQNYEVLGPTVRDGAIVYDRIARLADLPAGWTDRQEAGRYRLERRDDGALFGFAVGPQAWKRFLHPPVETLWTMRSDRRRRHGRKRRQRGSASSPSSACAPASCTRLPSRIGCFHKDLTRILAYAMRRRDAFIVAVNCGQAGGTCFCVSMQTGPKATAGFDLALTELLDGASHRISGRGRQRSAALEFSRELPHRLGHRWRTCDGRRSGRRANAGQMGRRLETDGLKELLQSNLDSSALG